MKISRVKDAKFSKPVEDYPYGSSSKVFISDQIFIFRERLGPGKDASAPHYHSEIDEVIMVTQGQVYAIEGEEETELNAGDSVLFKANSKKKHYIQNRSSSDSEFMVIRQNSTKTDVIY